MKIQSAADLQAFMERHKLSSAQVAKILGYSHREYPRHGSVTVWRMKSGAYNWEKLGDWVEKKLNDFVKKRV